jgi:hypothetical protein
MTSYITRRNDNEILIFSNSFLTVYSEGIRLLYSARIMPKFTANTFMLPFGGHATVLEEILLSLNNHDTTVLTHPIPAHLVPAPSARYRR